MAALVVFMAMTSVPAPVLAADILFSYDADQNPQMYRQIRQRQFPVCVKTGRVIRPADGVEVAAMYRCLKAVTSENDQTVVALFGPESAPIQGWGPEVFDSQSAVNFTNAAKMCDSEAQKIAALERNLFVDHVSRRPDAMACYQAGTCRAAWDAWLQQESGRLQQWIDYYRHWGLQYRQSIGGIQSHLQSQRAGAAAPAMPASSATPGSPTAPGPDSQGILGICLPNDPNCRQ